MEETRKPGRPSVVSEEDRRARILEAAETTFVSNGYAASSMDDIARMCGMSKKTLYQAFDTKLALFTAVIVAVLHERPVVPLVAIETGAAQVLETTLLGLAHFVLAPRQVALTRLVIAESVRSPELAAVFQANAIKDCKLHLEKVVQDLSDAGLLASDDAMETATCLFGAVMGERLITALIGHGEPFSPAALQARVARVVRTVC